MMKSHNPGDLPAAIREREILGHAPDLPDSEARERKPVADSIENSRAHFPTTHWGVVVAAGADASKALPALEDLCRAYWPPIYAECRRRGQSPPDAQDSTQEFFACLLRRDSFSAADLGRGRFRTFLLGALDNFLTDQWREKNAEKRG